MAEQLTFDLPVRASRRRGDFFVSAANSLAVQRLEAVDTWPLGKLILVGPAGSGKSHLTYVWAEANGGLPVATVGVLPTTDIPEIDEPVAVELQDDLGAASAREEEALFHLHNHMAAQGLPLLLIARKPPSQWKITLPDLRSRMEGTDLVRIEEPDDDLLAAVLVKLFTDRQLIVDPKLIPWLVTRMERSFAGAQALVNALDKAALASKKRVNRGLAATVLDKLAQTHT